MSIFKPRIIIPLAICAGVLGWWLEPHYSQEDKAYYVSVFCAIHHEDSSQYLKDMQTVIDGGNSDYALQKIKYQPALGEAVFKTWQQLPAEEQQPLFSKIENCRKVMDAQMK